jgi:D-sedoheptulose 7-phosphate isomerase
MHNEGVIREEIQARYRSLMAISDSQIQQIDVLADVISAAFKAGRKIYAFGNGGSAAEAQHFTTELIGRFKENRISLPAISLCSDSSALTCIANDFGFDFVFSRQVEGLVEHGDVVVGFTTSGSSRNVLAGLESARKVGAKAVLITGERKIPEIGLDNMIIQLGGFETAIIQESHLMLIHILSELIEIKMELKKPLLSKSHPRVISDREFKHEMLPENGQIVWVNGCFDILHEGHLLLLDNARRAGGYLVVGINSDQSVRKLKGETRPLIAEMNRARLIAGLFFVDLVIIFSGEDPLEILSAVRPSIVIKGEDYRETNFIERVFLEEIGCEIRFTGHIQGVSSSEIISNFTN